MEQVNKGRKMMIAVIIINLTLSFALIALNSAMKHSIGKTDEAVYTIAQGAFRFILECLMFLFIYKGHRWARILALILFAVGGLLAIITIFTSSALMLLIAVPYIISVILLTNKDVVAYQRYAKDGNVEGS